MWKAHKQGLSLTPASSFQSAKEYNKNFANGQRSGTSSPYRSIGRHSRKGSRVKGRGSVASTMRTSGSTQSTSLSKQLIAPGPAYNIPWINHVEQLDMNEVDSDAPSINAVRGKGITRMESTWASDEILDRGMIADSSFNTRHLWQSGHG